MERMEIQPFGNEYKSQQVRLIIVFLATLEIISHAVTATVMHLLNFNPPIKAHRVLLWVLCILIGWMSLLAGGFGFGKCSSLCVLLSFGILVLVTMQMVLAGVFVEPFIKVYPMYLGSIVVAVGLMIASAYYRIRSQPPEFARC